MKNVLLFILLALVLSPLNSCKKDDEPSKTELLTNGIWYGVNQVSYIDGVLDFTYDSSGLQVDFKTDNTGIAYYEDEEYEDVEFIWNFQNDETQLSLDDELADIETLTTTSFVFIFELVENDDTTYKTITSLKRY